MANKRPLVQYSGRLAELSTSDTVPVSILENLTSLRVVVTDSNGKLTVSAATSTEASYLSGVTSAIQTQLDNKQPLDADLTAIAALSSTGILSRTGTNTWQLFSTTGSTNVVALQLAPTLKNLLLEQNADGNDALSAKRFTDTSPTGNFVKFTNNAGSTTLLNIDMSGQLHTAGTLFVGSTSAIQWGDSATAGTINGFLAMTGNGVFRFGDSAGGGSPRIILGSATNAFVSLLRNGTALDIKLGDNSGYGNLNVGTILSGTWNGSVIGSNYGGAGSISGILKANGSGVVSAAIAGTDYAATGTILTSGLTMNTNRLLGRTTASAGAIEEISVGAGLSFSSGILNLPDIGTPGTYVTVTTDAKGRVTSGTTTQNWSTIVSTPTTISGYGITDAYTKTEVDNLVSGLDFKQSVRVATTANITLSGSQTIDGVTLSNGDRVLVKNQTTGSENGIYSYNSAGAWTRTTDADQNAEVTAGLYCFVSEGTVNADSGWVLVTDNPITVGTTSLTFSQFNGLGQINAGAGLTKTGNTLDIGTASTSRIVINADNIDLATTGVSANTYKSVTVDVYGRVTAGTNPTTLAGYGITDAQPLDADLTSIAGLVGTSGLLRKTATDTWTLDTSAFITGLNITDDTSTNATRYLTFTSATSGSITGENVATTKLTFNPSTGAVAINGASLALSQFGVLKNSTYNTETSSGIYIQSGGTGTKGLLLGADNSNAISYIQAISIATSYISNLSLNPNAGNVGIGTITPNSFKLEIAGNVGPEADNTRDLGSAVRRWANVYATNFVGSITPSGFTAGSVIFAGSGGTLTQDNTKLFFDNTNDRLGIGTNTPAYNLDNAGTTNLQGVTYLQKHKFDAGINYESDIYFAPQPYIEVESFPYTIAAGNIASYPTNNDVTIPFSKCIRTNAYLEFYSDYIPVQPGEVLYGEIWAMRDNGASGTAGTLYCGIARYDRDKLPITINNGLTYFISSNQTVPTTGVWTKYSGAHTLPTTHTPYNSSDGGPVRYIRYWVIANYTAGTIPTSIGGMLLRRRTLGRDVGDWHIQGNLGIGVAPSYKLDVAGVINTNTGFRISGSAATGNYLRGNGTNFVSSTIQVSDVPTLNQSTTGSAGTLDYEDNRTISPSELATTKLKFGFTSYNNNNTAPYADFLHMRSYVDSSGGDDTLIVFNKAAIGARFYRQAYGSASAYATYKDFVLADNSPTVNYLPKYTSTGNTVTVANSLIFDNGTNVGINTTSPAQKLDVNGIIQSSGASAEFRLGFSFSRVATIDGEGGFGGGYNFRWNGGSPIHDSTGALSGYGYTSGGEIRWYTNSSQSASTAAQQRAVITNAGNFGISTPTPSEKLEVVGNIYINNDNSGLVVDASSNARTGFMKYAGIEGALVHGNTVPLRFGEVNQASVTGGAFTEQMRIAAGGNVSVGTTVTNHKFTVNQSGHTSAATQFTYGISLSNQGSDDFNIGSDATYVYLQSFASKPIQINNLGNHILLVPGSSNVGIGNTSPTSFKLQVSGHVGPNTDATYDLGSNSLRWRNLYLSGGIYSSSGSPLGVELSRTIPVVVNDYVEIGNFNLTGGTHNVRISISNSDTSFSVAKQYFITIHNNATANTWLVVPPIVNSVPAAQDYALDINVNNAVASFRLRRTVGTTAGTAKIRMESVGLSTDVFTETSATGSASAILDTDTYGSFTTNTITKATGIGTISPQYSLDIRKIVGYRGVYVTGGQTDNTTNLFQGSVTATANATIYGLNAEVSTLGSGIIRLANVDNAGVNSHSQLQLAVGGTSAGNPYASFEVPSGTSWSLGVDNANSDVFKINATNSLASGNRFAITTDGKVGIANANPTARLYVNGNPTGQDLIRAIGTGSQLIIGYNETSVNYFDGDTHNFRNGNGGTTIAVLTATTSSLTSSTSFTITSPFTLFSHSDSSTTAFNNASVIRLRNTDATVNNWSEIGFEASGGTVAAGVGSQITNHAGYGKLAFFTRSAATGFTEKLTILEGGNVGIGNTTPTYHLDVEGTGLRLKSTASSPAFWMTSADTGNSTINFGGTTNPDKGRIFYSDNSDFMAFYTADTERVRISTAGLVGINTTSPGAALHVAGTSSDITRFGNSTNGASWSHVISSPDANGIAIIMSGGNTATNADRRIDLITKTGGSQFKMYNNSGTVLVDINSAANSYINNSGNIGLGITAPVSKVDVGGIISRYFDTSGVYTRIHSHVFSYSTSGNPTTGTFKLNLPTAARWTNTMMRITITGYDYSSNGAWEVVVSGYNYSVSPTWVNTSAEIRGVAPFSSVRFADDGTNNCILLGTTSTTWLYPKINVVLVETGHSSVDTFVGTWSASFVTSEAGITVYSTPTIRQTAYSTGATANAFVQNGNSFGANAVLGTNDNYRLDFETNNIVRATISVSGNVGFGTTDPSVYLHGTVGLTVFHATSPGISIANSSGTSRDWLLYRSSDDHLRLYESAASYASGVDRFLFRSGGEFVVNTAEAWITGRTTAPSDQNLIRSRGMGYSPAGYVGVQIGNTNNHIALFIDPGSITSASFNGTANEIFLPNNVRFVQANSGGTNWLYSTNVGTLTMNDGRVAINGIGTEAGNFFLEVRNQTGGTSSCGAKVGVLSLGNSGGGYPVIGDNLRFTTGSTYQYERTDTSSMIDFAGGNLNFFTAPAGTAGNTITHTSRMFIRQSDGNVGIGNTNPGASYKLDVTGAIHASGDGSSVAYYIPANMSIRGTAASQTHYLDLGRTYLRGSDGGSGTGLINISGGLNVGSALDGTTPVNGELLVNGLIRLKGAGSHRNLSVLDATYNGVATGAIIINTPIPRASDIMFKIRIHGYAYGAADDRRVIDFTFVGYAYSSQNGPDSVAGNLYAKSFQDNGNDGQNKYIGINSSGNFAIAFGDPSYAQYITKIIVDCEITHGTLDVRTGWTTNMSSATDFGWLFSKTSYGTFNSTLYRRLNINNVTNSIGLATVIISSNGTAEAALQLNNNVNSGFGNYGSYQALLYNSGSSATSYGIGIEASFLNFNSGQGYKFYETNTSIFTIRDVGGAELKKATSTYFTSNTWGGSTTPAHALVLTNPQPSSGGAFDSTLIFRQRTSTGTDLTSGAVNITALDAWSGTTSTQVSKMQFILRNTSGLLVSAVDVFPTGNVAIAGTLTVGGNQVATGTGTTNRLVKWGTTTSLVASNVTDNGTQLGISQVSPTSTFHSGGSVAYKITTTTTNLTLDGTHHIVLVDSTSAARTITLPTAVGITERVYKIKDWKGTSPTNNIIITTTSGQLIEGVSSLTIDLAYDWIEVMSDGAGWIIIG